MSTITPAIVVPPVPQYPALGSANFNQEAYTYATTMPSITFALSQLAQGVENNAQIAVNSAGDALVYKNQAQAALQGAVLAQSAAESVVNFKGMWSDLSGPLTTPATVKHNNLFWLLLRDLSQVQDSEPGVSEDWTSTLQGSQLFNSTSLTYVGGRLDNVVVDGVTTQITYDSLQRVSTVQFPIGDKLRTETFTYGLDGRLSNITASEVSI